MSSLFGCSVLLLPGVLVAATAVLVAVLWATVALILGASPHDPAVGGVFVSLMEVAQEHPIRSSLALLVAGYFFWLVQ